MELAFDLQEAGTTDIRLAVLDGENVLWPHPRSGGDGAALFDAEDVISYLADAWASLLLSEVWPDIFGSSNEPHSITGLLRAAEKRWEQLLPSDEAEIASEQSEIEAFLYKHNLRSMKNGGALSDFYVLRQGNRYLLEVDRQEFSYSYTSFVEQLERLGAFARANLVKAGPQYSRTIARWDARNQADPVLLISHITGLRCADLDREPDLLEPLLSTLRGRSLNDIANDNAAPLVAVARSSGSLGPRGIADMIGAFRTLPHGPTTPLDIRRRKVQAEVRQLSKPLDQGVRAATSIRDWLNAPADAAFDLQLLSDQLGVAVQKIDDLDGRIDGLASIGPEHGPAILLNRNTKRRGATAEDLDRVLRFTWAHELGHLLLDNGEWPAIIDSAQQRVPRWIETRANAFAAYLLLPPTLAYQAMEDLKPRMSWTDIEPALNEIGTRFKITRIVASRQIERGAPPERRKQLRTVFQQNIQNF